MSLRDRLDRLEAARPGAVACRDCGGLHCPAMDELLAVARAEGPERPICGCPCCPDWLGFLIPERSAS